VRRSGARDASRLRVLGGNVKIEDVVFRDDLYPRIEKSPLTVQKYAEDLSVLPPIEVNQHGELIDGWHRWTAHKKNGAAEINVIVTETTSDAHLLELAIERNAKFGLQLSQSDKRDAARRIYSETPLDEQGKKKERLADILSVSVRIVQGWLSRMDKDNAERRNAEIVRLWLACHTEHEIAKLLGMPRTTVESILTKNEGFRISSNPHLHADLSDEEERWRVIAEENRAAAEHATDFTPPLYNIWKQQERTAGSSHPGNTDVRWLDNLLYLYTEPFDVVVDPFAGGGSTIDICKKRWRRYWASDRKPVVEREDIREHDLTEGLPKLPRWADVGLVYLDPPYWIQAEGEYSDDPTDLANMSLEDFTKTLSDIVKAFAKKLKDACIALVIQPTQWRAPDRQFTDHVGDMLRLVKLPVEMRYSVPYESQQCTAQMVEWAKAEKKCLVLTREIVVWRVE